MMRQLRLNQIKSVGLELEGGYCLSCLNPLFDQYCKSLHLQEDDDGSVEVEGVCHTHDYSYNSCTDGWTLCGEIKVWVEVEKLPLLFEFVDKLFKMKNGREKCFKQNSTCGNHLHVKFRHENTWKKFINKEAWAEFVASYCKLYPTAKYTRRLHNRYCDSHWEDEIGEGYYHTRYRMINVRSIGETQQTLEFRILPHFGRANEPIPAYEKMLNLIDTIASRDEMGMRR